MKVSSRILALCFGLSIFAFAEGRASAQTALEVIPVPWNALDTSVPHQAYNDKQIIFKAIARGGATGTWTYRWDFDGDGTFDFTTGSSTNRYDLSATHTFTGVTTTTTYNAVVEVTNGTETVTATYPVRVFADVPADPTMATDRQLQVMRGVAVDDALWYQHTQMSTRTGDEFNPIGGSQITGTFAGTYPDVQCATLVWGMSLNGHTVAYPPNSYVGTLPDVGENDVRWSQDPYAEDVLRCVNTLLNTAVGVTGLNANEESNLTGSYPEVDATPIQGTDDGVGLRMGTSSETYAMGHILAALSVAKLAGHVAQVGNATYVLGRTMEHVIQQIVDYVVYAQGDTVGSNYGGWHYAANQANPDLSTHLWAITGLWHAEEFMGADGVIVNNFAKTRMLDYLEWRTLVPAAGERCGNYTNTVSGCSWTINAAHIFLLGWLGARSWDATDPFPVFPGYTFPDWTTTPTRGALRTRFDEFKAYISRTWLTSNPGGLSWNTGLWNGSDDGTGTILSDWTRTDSQGCMYCMLHYQDAARAAVPVINEYKPGNDWAQQASIFLVNNQQADGHYQTVNTAWTNTITDSNAGPNIQTGWAILILSPDAIPPLAIGQASTLTANEGDPITFNGDASDPGTGNPTYMWDFDNGDTANGSDAVYAYPDNGTYNATLTATSIGGTSVDTVTLTINNVAPTADIGGDITIDEGDTVNFNVAITDPGTADTHTAAWDFGDSNNGTGLTPAHTYADNGTYTVMTTVTDDDGDSGSDTKTVTVNNVAPTITSTPAGTGTEGTAYTYTMTYTDPGTADTHTCSLPTAPTGMTLTGCAVDWTPDFAAAIGSSPTVKMCVTDNDGGQACQTWTITLSFTDTDGDGLPDSWEVNNFGDLSQDQFGDPDGDGLNNQQEFTGATDPNMFDGPNAPSASAPTCGNEITSAVPTLEANNAVDPQGTALTYNFEVYRDAALNLLVAQVDNIAEGGSGTTSWTLPNALDENVEYFWRVRSNDGNTYGAWSAVCSFFVNVVNDPPGAPSLATPGNTMQVNSFTPDLTVNNATDPDRDTLTYTVEVYSDANLQNLVTSTTGVTEGGSGTTTWTVDTTLTEDTRYWWRARATDDLGLDGDWSDTYNFFVTTANNPPEAPTILTPQNGTIVASLTPTLTILNSDDSDFDPLSFEFELASDDTFATIIEMSTQIPAQGANNTSWGVTMDLTENESYCWRARANDGQATSAWVVSCFLVSVVNDPPAVPTLMNPSADSTVRVATPGYSWVASSDPEGDAVVYDIEVMDDGGNVVASQDAVSGNSIQINYELTDGATYTWRVRAVDNNGLASEWSEPNGFTVDIRDGGDIVVNGSGCSVNGGGGSAATMLLMLGVAFLIARRRRD